MLYIFAGYIEVALERAVYKAIEDDGPIFVSVPELPGAWAAGKTVEEARKELISVIEGWIALGLWMIRSIPSIGATESLASWLAFVLQHKTWQTVYIIVIDKCHLEGKAISASSTILRKLGQRRLSRPMEL